MDLEIEFGEYLKQMRGSKSLDQVSAETGLDKGYLWKMEQGQRHPKPDKFPALSKAYGVSLTALFQLSGYLTDEFIICRAKDVVAETENFRAQEILNDWMKSD